MFLRRLCLSLLSCGLFALPQGVIADEKPVFDQVVEILSSDSGTVRKWIYPPKVTVIHDGDPQRDAITGLVDLVNAQIPNFPGVGAVEYYDLSQFNRSLAGNTRFRMRTNDFNGVEGTIVRAHFAGETAEQDTLLTGNIFIFLTGLDAGITFGALTQSGEALSRQFAEGTATKCYFNLMSRNDELRAGFIFINNDDDTNPIAECLYEEFLQTLGLLNDSQDSSLFSFDNTIIDREDKAPDFRLLEALYSSEVSAGDAVAKVANLYMTLD